MFNLLSARRQRGSNRAAGVIPKFWSTATRHIAAQTSASWLMPVPLTYCQWSRIEKLMQIWHFSCCSHYMEQVLYFCTINVRLSCIIQNIRGYQWSKGLGARQQLCNRFPWTASNTTISRFRMHVTPPAQMALLACIECQNLLHVFLCCVVLNFAYYCVLQLQFRREHLPAQITWCVSMLFSNFKNNLCSITGRQKGMITII